MHNVEHPLAASLPSRTREKPQRVTAASPPDDTFIQQDATRWCPVYRIFGRCNMFARTDSDLQRNRIGSGHLSARGSGSDWPRRRSGPIPTRLLRYASALAGDDLASDPARGVIDLEGTQYASVFSPALSVWALESVRSPGRVVTVGIAALCLRSGPGIGVDSIVRPRFLHHLFDGLPGPDRPFRDVCPAGAVRSAGAGCRNVRRWVSARTLPPWPWMSRRYWTPACGARG